MPKAVTKEERKTLSNAVIAELLAVQAEKVEGVLQKAFRRASRAALLWPEEALHLLATERSLTELAGVGPFIEKTILRWIDKPPGRVRVPPIRRGFLTLVEARRILNRKHPPFPKGDLQMHSVWSDGAGTIPAMAEAGRALGYEYIGITDHSKGLKIAGGIDEAALRRQREEIRGTNEALLSAGFRVLAGIEMNLNPRGEGDMDPAALAELDFVVGSFHSKLRVKEDQTERYLAAVRNPDIQILGHPRGRIYNFRVGLTADWPRVFAEAARWDKAVEIDAYPDRQDLNVELVKIARDAGAKLAIDTDAHNPDQLAFVELGLAGAMSVNFPIERIINYLPADKLLAWVSEVRDRGARTQSRRKILATNGYEAEPMAAVKIYRRTLSGVPKACQSNRGCEKLRQLPTPR